MESALEDLPKLIKTEAAQLNSIGGDINNLNTTLQANLKSQFQSLEQGLTGDLAGVEKQMADLNATINRMFNKAESQLESLESQAEKDARKLGGLVLAGVGLIVFMNSGDMVFKTAGAMGVLGGMAVILT